LIQTIVRHHWVGRVGGVTQESSRLGILFRPDQHREAMRDREVSNPSAVTNERRAGYQDDRNRLD